MPKGRDEIYPFLVPIDAFRALEYLIHARKDLVCQGDEIVLQRNTRLHVEIVLTADQFQLLSYSIHRSIFAQFLPAVKTIFCDLERILLVVLHLPYRIFGAVVVNDERIDDGNKDAVLMKFGGDRLMVAACRLHQDLRFFP